LDGYDEEWAEIERLSTTINPETGTTYISEE
jgi:hypothetical protein